jgi:hypothetical protein
MIAPSFIKEETMTQFTQRARAIALRTARRAALAGVLLAGAVSAMAQSETPVGTWRTIDDHTGQPKALVQIADDGSGQLSGKVIAAVRPVPMRVRINSFSA